MKSTDHVGITFVNGLLGRGIMNGVVNLTFFGFQFTPTEHNSVDPDPAITCRLRMDIPCAKALYDHLGKLLATVETPEAPPPAEAETVDPKAVN